MRNENEYIRLKLNGHKAVESGDNQFVFRVDLGKY